MRESIITKDIVRRFLVVSKVDAAEIERIVEGLLYDLPIRDVLDEIVMLVDDLYTEDEAVERLTICALAERLLVTERSITFTSNHAADRAATLGIAASELLALVDIPLHVWESSRANTAAP